MSETATDWSHRLLTWLLVCCPSVLVAMLLMPMFGGGQLWPWAPDTPFLGDMAAIGHSMASGHPVFGAGAPAVLGYTPFGALLTGVTSAGPLVLWRLALTVASVASLAGILGRTTSWSPQTRAAVMLVAVCLVAPVRDAIVAGQIVLPLLWLVVSDLPMTGSGRRRFPAGTATGLAGAIWPPLWWALMASLLAGRRRHALVGVGVGAFCSFLGWIVFPAQTEALLDHFTSRIPGGAVSMAAALFGVGAPVGLAGLAGWALALLATVVAARWWQHDRVMALGIVLVGAVVAHPPAQSWHLAVVVPAALGLWQQRDLRPAARFLGALWCAVVASGLMGLLAARSPGWLLIPHLLLVASLALMSGRVNSGGVPVPRLKAATTIGSS